MWKSIYYGYYEINRAGVIRRVKSGKGTWPGRTLVQYNDRHGPYVKLCREGQPKQFRVDVLRSRAWKR